MAPQTVQSLQLLAMPLFALKSFLCGIVLENPYLEFRFDVMETPLSACTNPKDAFEGDFAEEALLTREAGSLPYLDQLYAPEWESLYDHLMFQAGLYAFTVTESAVAECLISSINAAGYLEESPETAAVKIGCHPAVAQHVLGIIQGFTPQGVGARNLSECLCLQVNPRTVDHDILMQILREDIAALAGREFDFLARKYKVTRQRVQKMLDYVQTLNPKPGSGFSSTRFTQYIIPDAKVTPFGRHMEIVVGGEASTMLVFNADYMKDVTDEEASAFLKLKRTEAVNLVNSIDMRSRVLKSLVGYLAVEQRAFFSDRAAPLKPMTQKKAAADLGMYPSTICRCVREKYIETIRGCIALNSFFSGELEGGCSAAQARGAIGTLIAGEDKSAPLSDLAISEVLAGNGIQVSRRTVAKYRAQLGLSSTSGRIRYT
jgi:RNA polymerase sigma-54 factor